MRIGSLFSGYGGLDRAIEATFPGAEPAWFCEWDEAPSKVLAHHWPEAPNYRDVSAVDWTGVEPVDILTGGFPCQDVSHAGRRSGLIRDGDGRTRSGLWGEMLKAIDTLRPPLVVAENVRGLLSATADSDVEPCSFCMGDGGASPMRALGAVLADLADIGYDAAWCGLRAADVGAPHGRFRVFILAWPSDGYPAGLVEEWRDGEGGRGGRSEAPARDASGDRGATNGAVTLLPTPDAYAGSRGGAQDPVKRAEGGHAISLADVAEYSIQQDRLLPTPLANDFSDDISTLEERQARGYGNHLRDLPLMLPGTVDWGEYADAIARWERVLGRVAPAPTEPGPRGNPRLSPRFVEWLMGLPAGHVTGPDVGLTRNQQLKALGNGVVPQQGAEALSWLLGLFPHSPCGTL